MDTRSRIDDAMSRLRSGLGNPDEILPFVLGTVAPASLLADARGYQSAWERRDGYITFEEGGFAGGTANRPEFAARTAYEASQLRSLLTAFDVGATRSVELGSGYGRLSPWIADFSAAHYGVEPNETQVATARRLYPDVEWVERTAQDLPFPDDHFDLLVSWTVLQHVPPESLRAAIREIERVATDDAVLVLCEETVGEAGVNTWPRSTATYDRLLSSFSLEATHERALEPTYPDHAGEVMVFEQD